MKKRKHTTKKKKKKVSYQQEMRIVNSLSKYFPIKDNLTLRIVKKKLDLIINDKKYNLILIKKKLMENTWGTTLIDSIKEYFDKIELNKKKKVFQKKISVLKISKTDKYLFQENTATEDRNLDNHAKPLPSGRKITKIYKSGINFSETEEDPIHRK